MIGKDGKPFTDNDGKIQKITRPELHWIDQQMTAMLGRTFTVVKPDADNDKPNIIALQAENGPVYFPTEAVVPGMCAAYTVGYACGLTGYTWAHRCTHTCHIM